MQEKFLEKVYEARDVEQTRAVYDAWSASYDSEVAENGYVTPERCAAALADVMEDKAAPILDFGCGTGLSGEALRRAGFTVIDGVDLSAEMLAQADAKGIYRKTTVISEDAEFSQGAYAVIAAIGVIGAGAAPVDVLDKLMYALDTGGKLVFSFNDHTLADPMYEARVSEWTDCGAARLLVREYGDHLPGKDLKSFVYVLEKA